MEYGDKRRVAVRGIIYKDGKLFCQQLKDRQGNPRDFWCTPGGGLNPKELLVEAVARELIEETGVLPEVGRLLFIQSFADGTIGGHGEEEQLEFFDVSLLFIWVRFEVLRQQLDERGKFGFEVQLVDILYVFKVHLSTKESLQHD